METPEYFHGSYYRAGTPQHTPEKPGKSGGGDHFIVDDLLDFSHEEEEEEAGHTDGASDAAAGNSTDSSAVTAVDSCSNSSSGPDPHFSGALVCRSFADASLSGDLCEPQYDQLAELEWLSNFAEESFSSEDLEKLKIISGIKASSSSSGIRSQISAAVADRTNQSSLFLPEGPVPGKARSKRSRAAPCSWSSSPLIVVSPAAPATTSSSVCDALVPSNPFKKLPKPAKKKDPSAGPAASDGRKCLHCATEKTPQWRTGPMGPKTLCNACGVRYKSGRLVPEYRPAASPTFVLSKHSNSHRKVIELRRQKEPPQFLHPGAAAVYGGAGSASDGFLIHQRIGPDFRQVN